MYKVSMYRFKIVLAFAVLMCGACRAPEQRETVTNSTGGINTVSVSPAESDAAEPAVAVDKDGNTYVLYVDHHADKTADLFLQKLDSKAMGRTLLTTRVNPAPGVVKAWRGDPPTIAVTDNGTVYAGWTIKNGSGEKSGNDLVLSVSSDGGKSFGEPVRVNDDTMPVSHGMHSLLVTGDRVYMAWLDERNVKKEPEHEKASAPTSAMMFHHTKEAAEPNSEVFFSVSADGGKTFSPNKKLATEVCPCCKTSIAAAPDGRLYVAWRQVLPGGFRHIAVVSSVDKGANFGERVVVSDDQWKIDACPVSGASMVVNDKGLLSISWYSAGDSPEGAGSEKAGLFAAKSEDGGRTFSQRQQIGGGAVSGTPVMLIDQQGAPASVFAAKDEKVVVETGQIFGVDRDRRELISGASLPAAVSAAGKIYVAFVRATGEKRSIWLAVTPG